MCFQTDARRRPHSVQTALMAAASYCLLLFTPLAPQHLAQSTRRTCLQFVVCSAGVVIQAPSLRQPEGAVARRGPPKGGAEGE